MDSVTEPPEKHGQYQKPEAVLSTSFNRILDEVIVHVGQKFENNGRVQIH